MLVNFRVRLFSVLYAPYGSRPSPGTLHWEAEVNITRTYSLGFLQRTWHGSVQY